MWQEMRVLVIGDSCLDIFQYGKCERICPEAPVPVFVPLYTVENGGMATNVRNNLVALGVNVDLCTNTDIEDLPIKKRLVDEASNQIIVRIDEHDNITPLNWDNLKNIKFSDYHAIVISDYNKGFLTKEHIQYIAENHPLTFLDTKKKIDKWVNNIKYIKINEKEYNKNKEYLDNFYENNIIVTLGKNGAMLITNNNAVRIKVFPSENKYEVRDLTGAGDTFLSALVAEFIKSNNISNAIQFANKCASWAVSQKGVAVIDMKKLAF